MPRPVAIYLAAVKAKDAGMLALCFADDARVHDENSDYRGLDAIRAWKQETDAKYRYVMEPLDASISENTVKLRARLTGSRSHSNNIHTPKNMKTPSIIAAFVKAKNGRDTNAVVACFAHDAVVHDEGKKMIGLTAITKWSDEGFKKYQYTIDPTGIAKGDKETILTATLTGNFPGSPVSLDFRFTIKNDKIGGLTIG